MYGLPSQYRIGAFLTGIVLILGVSPAIAQEWMSPSVKSAAEQVLAAMPDDYFTVRDVAAEKEIARGGVAVLDVREPSEFAAEHIPRAVNIPIRSLLKMQQSLPNDKSAPVLVYCKTGHRGAIALTMLRMVGYVNVRSIYGGLDGWKAAGFPIAK